MTICCERGDLQTFRRLMSENPESLKTCGDLCIEYASENGHVDIVKELLRHGVDPNSRTIEDETPLHNASYNGHLDIVKELLMVGSHINAICYEGWTPLHCATVHNYFNIVKELLSHGADANKQAFGDGSTALHFAIENNDLALVQALVPYANLDLKTDDGYTVFDLNTTDAIKQYLYDYRNGADIKEPEFD